MPWVSLRTKQNTVLNLPSPNVTKVNNCSEIAISQAKDETAQNTWLEPDCAELVDD
jgi:hypothetical protein